MLEHQYRSMALRYIELMAAAAAKSQLKRKVVKFRAVHRFTKYFNKWLYRFSFDHLFDPLVFPLVEP
uniref:hypothetical protein n=1 Tax=Klebsiella pneumoniae TaxID=573 RepID=UPI0025A2E414